MANSGNPTNCNLFGLEIPESHDRRKCMACNFARACSDAFEDGGPNWGDVIPFNGEVSPAECADYPTAMARPLVARSKLAEFFARDGKDGSDEWYAFHGRRLVKAA